MSMTQAYLRLISIIGVVATVCYLLKSRRLTLHQSTDVADLSLLSKSDSRWPINTPHFVTVVRSQNFYNGNQIEKINISKRGRQRRGSLKRSTSKSVSLWKLRRKILAYDSPAEVEQDENGGSFKTHPQYLRHESIRATQSENDGDRVDRTASGKADDKGGRNTQIDITAQLPQGSSGQASNKVIEDQLSGLLTKILSKWKSEDRYDEEDSEKETTADYLEAAEESVSDQKDGAGKFHQHLNKHGPKPSVKPALNCEEYDEVRNVCFYNRNVGDTITFQLRYENLNQNHILRVQWRQEFHIRNSNQSKHVEISQDDATWNVVVGSNGKEFRISPITETDLDFNQFSATVTFTDPFKHNPFSRKVNFAVRPVPIDLGFVYRGEQLILNVESFVSLPLESLEYHWFMERDGEKSTLPSNMKISPSGSSVAISELRKEQEGIITCAIYKSRSIFLTKKRFLIKEINKDILIHGLAWHNPEQGVSLQPEVRLLRRFVRNAELNDISSKYQEDSSIMKPKSPNNHSLENPLYANLQEQGNVQPPLIPQEKFSGNTVNKEYIPQNGQPWFLPQNLRQNIPEGKAFQQTGNELLNAEVLENQPEGAENFIVQIGNRNRLRENVDDKIAMLIGQCSSNRECSGHASCYLPDPSKRGLCRCHSGYRGNGIFCWEMIVPGHPTAVESSITINSDINPNQIREPEK